jgi:membrane protein
MLAVPLILSRFAGRDRIERRAFNRARTLFQIALNVVTRVGRDNLMLVAAGVAFYAMTSIFPAIAAFVSVYGLFADPTALRQEILAYSDLLPRNALSLMTDALANFASKSNSTLSLALLISLGIAFWSAKAGIAALITGLNIANETTEKRSLVALQLTGLSLTVGGVLFAVVAFIAVAVAPAALAYVSLAGDLEAALRFGRWPMLAVLVAVFLAVIYRYGPCRERAKWRWITLGSSIATLLWLVVSGGFSLYVSRFASYDKTYGSLAAPVALLLWFWLSALMILVGAEIDAEMEHADGDRARALPEGAP